MGIDKMRRRRLIRRAVLIAIGAFFVAQLIPYGRSHSNPPVTRAPQWDSATTKSLVAKACNDCHSNLTTWRWYSNIAPASWLIQRDVDSGRGALNFSEWDKPQPDIGEVVDAVGGSGMPPLQYTLIHPSAKLSSSERDALVRGLRATWAKDPPPPGGGGG